MRVDLVSSLRTSALRGVARVTRDHVEELVYVKGKDGQGAPRNPPKKKPNGPPSGRVDPTGSDRLATVLTEIELAKIPVAPASKDRSSDAAASRSVLRAYADDGMG